MSKKPVSLKTHISGLRATARTLPAEQRAAVEALIQELQGAAAPGGVAGDLRVPGTALRRPREVAGDGLLACC